MEQTTQTASKESLPHVSKETSPLGDLILTNRQKTTDTIVYEIVDYTTSLEHAYEMLQKGWHVTSLTFSKELPRPKSKCHDILLMEGC